MPQNQECVLREESANGRALGKCVSASHICQSQRPIVTITNLSRSQNALVNAPAGYILRADGRNINITKVDDITEWIDPPAPLKRTSPDAQLNNIIQDQTNKTRKVDDNPDCNLPCFLRNQSVEGLESQSKHDVDTPFPFCRHISIPDNCESQDEHSDSDPSCSSLKIIEDMDVDQQNKKPEKPIKSKKDPDVKDVTLRNPSSVVGNERRIPEVDYRRHNINHINENPLMAAGLKNMEKSFKTPKTDNAKPVEKTNFFSKNLLSPKLSRLFKQNTAEVQRNKTEIDENKEEKSRSKFFIQRPASPGANICRSYRVRPKDEVNMNLNDHKNKMQSNLLKSDIKLANLGKPMTPIFRRHIPTMPMERNEFMDGRFSYRDRRSNKYEAKNADTKFVLGKNRIRAPTQIVEKNIIIANNHNNNFGAFNRVDKPIHSIIDSKVIDNNAVKRREPGISKSNYVSLANLKIDGKAKELKENLKGKGNGPIDCAPIERVI